MAEIINADILFFFDGKPIELSLYEALAGALIARFPETEIRVQKTQISFYDPRMYCCVSLAPVRRKAERPERFITVSFGLGAPLCDPRALSVQVRPNRTTHHVVIGRADEIDGQLLEWIVASWRLGRGVSNGGCADPTDLR